MLHRSFKPAKCKTSLKLASARIKLLKNKKEIQLKQLKKEVAQLLESGQDRTARIRVEHVVREEKTIAAYELIEIYCELIVARLTIIESQKNCPIDLKEAIASVIFASPRCADIPELLDISKNFTAKYGKEFKSAAVELRPNCGVSRMLIEKLSATAPDGQTKLRILSAIAEEHNIKWDPNSVGEGDSKPPDDLLNGPNSLEMASKLHVEPPNVQGPKDQALPSHDQKHDPPVNSEQNLKSSPTGQNFASADLGGTKTTSTTSRPEVRPSGIGAERMEVEQSFSRDRNEFSFGVQNWNMEFKDATSAAQAAAESAERASMAARAAAELSSLGKISRQYSTESQKLNVHGIKDKGPGNYDALKLPGEHLANNSVNNSFNDRNPEIHNEQIYGIEHDYLVRNSEGFYQDGHDGTKRSSQSASSRPRRTSIDDDAPNRLEKVDRYSQRGSSEDESVKANEHVIKMKMKKQESEEEFVSDLQDGLKSENFNYFGEETITKQSSNISSHYHSSTLGDDYDDTNSNHQNLGNDAVRPFMAVDEGNITRDSRETSSYDNAAVFFDESGSDDDEYKFDIGPKYDEQDSKYFLSPGRKSLAPLSPTADSWSFREDTSGSLEKSTSHLHSSKEWPPSPIFSESFTESAEPSKPNNLSPVTFDDSDNPNSESEDELDKSRRSGTMDSSICPRKQNVHSSNHEPTQRARHRVTGSSSVKEGNSRSDRNPRLDSSSDDSDSLEVLPKNNRDTELNADFQRRLSSTELPVNQQSTRLGKPQVESNNLGSESSFHGLVDEGNCEQALQSSKLPSVHEIRDNVCTPDDTLKDDEFLNQASSESGKELNFGTLTGGLRNKGYRLPPIPKSPSGDASSSSTKVAEDRSSTIEHSAGSSPIRGSISSGVSKKVSNKTSPRAPIKHYNSDSDDSKDEFSDDSKDEFLQQTRRSERRERSEREPHRQKQGKEVNTGSILRASGTYFDSDSEEDLQKQTTLPSRGHSGSGFSRRTKASPSSRTSSYSKVRIGTEASVNADSGAERKPSRIFYGTETQPRHAGGFEQSSSMNLPASKQMPEPRIPSHEESSESSRVEQPSSVPQKTKTSDGIESPKMSASSGETADEENTVKKASHVHPKLPDYDLIAARLQSLRSNQQ
ncbi:uncharacterized protein LOC132277129 [Cornus florida]|uniref:uncharacterized protein LOC132277129 n=1 Tax=Cornus florida TaxID=4283 RepID=UPI0028A04EB1|nr:uncharacterized protein LOC132277129 [Cornus florida]